MNVYSFHEKMETALILCDGYFGTSMGKTANGLVRHSERFRIVGVIDRSHSGMDAGEVLDGVSCGIPVYASLKVSLKELKKKPKFLIVGVAPIGGRLPTEFRPVIREAIKNRISIISGLHEFLSMDGEFSALAKRYRVKILDIRKEPQLEKMHQFRNLNKDIKTVRIPVLGTDSSIGKRTTALILVESLNKAGVKTVFVATGQTGLLQGARYGIPLDAIRGDYMVGELEHSIHTAYIVEKPKVIVIEGQGSISHPAYVCGTRAIIMASQPSGIILQHAPKREFRNFGKTKMKLPMPTVENEIKMLELFSSSKVIAITINHENMTMDEVNETVMEYEKKYGLSACDPLVHGLEKVVRRIRELYGV